jgi:5-methyltetrahydrofolate--homocysteine methyltransferase
MTTSLPPLASHPFLDALHERVVVFDGAMGTSLQRMELTPDDFGGEDLDGCNEVLVRSRPDVIEQIHREFLEVGCDAVQTNTFGGAPWVLDEYGLGDDAEELNRLGAELARRACDAYATPERPRWVLGSIGPGTRAPTLSLGKDPAEAKDFIDLEVMEDGYRRQVRGLLDGGTDVLLIETSFDLLQIKAAVAAANDVFVERGERVPLIVQFTVEQGINTMLLGTEPLAAIAALDPLAIDVLGMNCATGPDDMREHVRTLSRHSRLPISVLPNAGIPHLEGDATVYPLDPQGLATRSASSSASSASTSWAAAAAPPPRTWPRSSRRSATSPRARARWTGSSVRPGAAGALTDPANHDDPTPAITVEWRPSLASLYSAQPIEQDTSFLVIGERANANGSKAFRELLLAEDWEAMVAAGEVADPGGRPRPGRLRRLRRPRRRARHGRASSTATRPSRRCRWCWTRPRWTSWRPGWCAWAAGR